MNPLMEGFAKELVKLSHAGMEKEAKPLATMAGLFRRGKKRRRRKTMLEQRDKRRKSLTRKRDKDRRKPLMDRRSLMKQRSKTAGLLRVARGDRLTERLLAAGSLSGAAGHAATKAKSGLAGEYGPEGSTTGAAIKGGIGGLLASLGLKGLARMGRRGR